ncbi:MAG: hypothetical protein ABW218_00425, partial [Casimicrobiaceae bacterium]
PISPDVVKLLNQARYIFAPPPTRVNAQGYAEDVPEDELAAHAQAAAAASAATEAGATPPQVISPADTPVLAAVPADAMPSDVAEGQAADDAPRQIRLPLDPADPPT